MYHGMLAQMDGYLCLICKEGTEDVTHFLLDCPFFKENVDSVWLNIEARITETNPLDGTEICNFISNLDGVSKVLLLLGGLPLPFDNATAILIKRFISSAVGKSLNCIRINYVSWRFRGLKENEKAFLILLFN